MDLGCLWEGSTKILVLPNPPTYGRAEADDAQRLKLLRSLHYTHRAWLAELSKKLHRDDLWNPSIKSPSAIAIRMLGCTVHPIGFAKIKILQRGVPGSHHGFKEPAVGLLSVFLSLPGWKQPLSGQKHLDEALHHNPKS